MNTFEQGFKYGLVSGLCHNRFRMGNIHGFGRYYSNPICACPPLLMYTMPSFSFGTFIPYSNPIRDYSFGFNFQNVNSYQPFNSNSYYSNNQTFFDLQNYSNTNSYSPYNFTPNFASPSTTFMPMATPFSFNTSMGNMYPFYNQINWQMSLSPPARQVTTQISHDAKTLAARWQKKLPKVENITEEFCQKVIDISKKIDCDAEDLMALMRLETIDTFSPSKRNKNSRATGLIQFMPETAKTLGTSIDKLAKMSAIEQLDWVEKYLVREKTSKGIKGKIDGATLYSLVFWPAAANKNLNYELETVGNQYSWNKGLDIDGNGKITKKELGDSIKKFRTIA